MSPRNLSLQRRVTLALATLVTLFIGLQSVLAYLSLAEQEDDLVDELVLAEARRVAAQMDAEGESALSLLRLAPHFQGWLLMPDGRTWPEPPPPALKSLKEGPHRYPLAGEELHVYVMTTAAGKLLVQYDASQNEDKVHDFGFYLFGLSLFCVAVGLAISHTVAGYVVAPIERLTRLLFNWAPNAPRATAGSDEEGRLLDAFGRVQQRFEEMLANERAHVANLRHELRTPLTALRTDLEMLLLAAPVEQRLRLQRALAAADALSGALSMTATATVNAKTGDHPPVALCSCIEDAWASLGDLPDAKGLKLDNQVGVEVELPIERHALLTILRNLMRNAVEHAAPAQLQLIYQEGMLFVKDDGPGIAPEDRPFIFERYYQGRRIDRSPLGVTGAEGNEGLGLAIARQVAELQGWQLTVNAVEPHGTAFSLKFSPARLKTR